MNKRLSFSEITAERKLQLQKISKIRGRDILVYAADPSKGNAPVMILPQDLVPFKDQMSNLKSTDLDLILETPGGIAETVEDMVHLIRNNYERLGIFVPGTAKSAGTIFTMAADEIFMGLSSSLGPIDAQVVSNGKRISADAFLDGLEEIKQDVLNTGKINPAYIPILQNISPGDIQHFENAQNFSKTLVKKWLTNYKFKYWEKHSSTGKKVSDEEKESQAQNIASKLCKHSDWLTHGRSIRSTDLTDMGLQILNYNSDTKLSDAIERYYTLLRITFDMTGIYKIFETCNSQIYQSVSQTAVTSPSPKPILPTQPPIKGKTKTLSAHADFLCPKCKSTFHIQLNLEDNVKLEKGNVAYPSNDMFVCPTCSTETNLLPLRLQVEAQSGLKVKLNK